MKYGTVERVLASMYGADKVASTTFRGRLKHLSRLGVPIGCHPGKGVEVDYGMDEIYQFLFCLELAEIGMTPTTIDNTLRAYWNQSLDRGGIRAHCDACNPSSTLLVYPSVMSARWKESYEADLEWSNLIDPIIAFRRVAIIPIGSRIQEFKVLVPDHEENKPIAIPKRKKGYPEAGILSL